MKLKLSLILLFSTIVTFGQPLKTFTTTMSPDTLCYLSIQNKKAYTAANALEVKDVLDLGLFITIADKKDNIIEWYNLKPGNDKVPVHLTGTKTAIAAISFDIDQFVKCKTVADLRRMTGHLTKNSLSHFAVIQNSAATYQRCFIIEKENGNRSLLFLQLLGNNRVKVEVKSE